MDHQPFSTSTALIISAAISVSPTACTTVDAVHQGDHGHATGFLIAIITAWLIDKLNTGSDRT
jgi:hypothetical protein